MLASLPKLLYITVAVLTGIGLPMSAAHAALFPETYETEQQILHKRGEYRYVYRMFFKLYEAALFTEKTATPEDILSAKVPFHLSFHYLRKIDKSIIRESAQKMLEKNLSAAEFDRIAVRVDQINAAYKTVNEGERSSLSYSPGAGTRLCINGMPVITIAGDDFARLYFQIWFGEKPISKPMKSSLIGTYK